MAASKPRTKSLKATAASNAARSGHASARASQGTGRKASQRWSAQVTAHSDALDLQDGVFKLSSAKAIAASLKRSAEESRRRHAGAYRSALSMLVLYINRAGKNLPVRRRSTLERAKVELKKLFGRE